MKGFLPTHEQPLHRFYASLNILRTELLEKEDGSNYILKLYPVIYSYYQESLALIRAAYKFDSSLEEASQSYEKEHSEIKGYLEQQQKKFAGDEDTLEWIQYTASQYSSRKLHYYWDIEAEWNVFASGAVVQLLSMFESTLHSLYKTMKSFDSELPEIQEVLKKDKGIVRYLKYFDSYINKDEEAILVGTPNYQNLCRWISFRNNIVHNNNESTKKLKDIIDQYKISISISQSKFIFENKNINELGEICGIALDLLIDGILQHYLKRKFL